MDISELAEENTRLKKANETLSQANETLLSFKREVKARIQSAVRADVSTGRSDWGGIPYKTMQFILEW
jgi:hypothetical protein